MANGDLVVQEYRNFITATKSIGAFSYRKSDDRELLLQVYFQKVA